MNCHIHGFQLRLWHFLLKHHFARCILEIVLVSLWRHRLVGILFEVVMNYNIIGSAIVELQNLTIKTISLLLSRVILNTRTLFQAALIWG